MRKNSIYANVGDQSLAEILMAWKMFKKDIKKARK